MTSKAISAVGAPAWIAAEKENVFQLLQQEKEELIYPAQHEMEWLNEHMSEIFSQSHLNVANVFKTPGKLRGKTPRTARKRNAADSRIPLSDIFSSKPLPSKSPEHKTKFKKEIPKLVPVLEVQDSRVSKSQTDSGYQGSSQSDQEIDTENADPVVNDPADTHFPRTQPAALNIIPNSTIDDVRTTEGSFHSAKEDQTTKVIDMEVPKHSQIIDQPLDVQEDDVTTTKQDRVSPSVIQHQIQSQSEFDEIGSPSDESTPDRPLIRKSSLTFASLPAREPLKQSLGNRVSRTSNLDASRVQAPKTTTQTTWQPAPGSADLHHADKDAENTHDDLEMREEEDDDDDDDDEDENIEILGYDESNLDLPVPTEYSKSSTQRLQERIDLLGKAPPTRTSKTVSSTVALNLSMPTDVMGHTRNTNPQRHHHDEEGDWIKPLVAQDGIHDAFQDMPHRVERRMEDEDQETEDEEVDLRAPELIAYEERLRTPLRISPSPGKTRPGYGHTKSASTATLASPGKAAWDAPPSPAKSISVSNPAFPTTTPQGSPRKILDGTLSASKSKLQSIMKTAKGLFTSSAGVSAAAKLETLSPNGLNIVNSTMPGMYPNYNGTLEDKPLPKSPRTEGQKLRNSPEREKEEKRRDRDVKAMQKMEDQLERVREKEKQKATSQKQNHDRNILTKSTQEFEASPKRSDDEQRMQNGTDLESTTGQTVTSKPLRPVKPGREPVTKTKPAPVAIRVGTLSQRMPMTTSSLASAAQDTLPAEPKRPGLSKQISNASMQSSASTTNLKSSVNAHPQKPRALLAAERKKEQDEREAQRKLEQRREIERKRAAQQEEARRQEHKQRAEAERKERERLAAEQSKRQVQQQAIERKRQQNARKAEEQRVERATAEENTSARPPSRLGNQPMNRSLINHPLPTNPAKPAKRPLEEDSTASRPQASKYGAASQQNDEKRRRTEDEKVTETTSRPTISGAPVRQSNLGKKPSIFNHSSYASTSQQAHSTQYSTVPPNRNIPQTSQFANGAKIPFAEAPNPPAQNKTPGSAYQHKTIHTIQAVKSSPQYPNGEAIHLPDIPTDSEDEDSEDEGNAFPIPDWATPGHLTDQLMRQEGMDGDAVFGPIAPLKMEEIFAKTNKDRLKRLRDRTSSANWAMSGDGLTLEEVRSDREQRERMRIEGGWRYGS